jgi:transposase
VIIIWDNLNTHYDGPTKRWTRFNERHGGRFEFVYTPKHASWLNQIELWFSILQRRVLRHASFGSKAELRERIVQFIDHYSAHEHKPFRWTFRGDFGQHRPKVHTSATKRRCPPTAQRKKTPKLSRNNFVDTALNMYASAVAARC